MRARQWIRRMVCALVAAVLLATTAAPALAVGQSTTLAKKGDGYYVAVSGLNLRSSPAMEDNIIRSLKKNTKLVFISEKYGWWRVQYAKGKYGYVDRQFLTRKNVPKTGTYKTTARLSLRTAPKTSATRITTIGKGKKVRVTQLNGDWVYVTYGSREGWVAAKYLKK